MRRVIPLATALVCALALAACGGSSSSGSSSGASTGTSSAASTATSSASGTGTSGATSTSSASQPAIGFEGVPLQTGPAVAPASTTGTGKVDGITCGPSEQLVYHIHAHLAVFKNGQAVLLGRGHARLKTAFQARTRVVAPPADLAPVGRGGRTLRAARAHAPGGFMLVGPP